MRFALLALVACAHAAPAPATWRVPTGWKSETFPFPLDFAPSIAHTGTEELRFAPGMFDPAAPGYWSYAFTWRTDDAAQLDADHLGAELTAYFAGLIAAVDTKHAITATDIAVHVDKDFKLTGHIYDAFKTNLPIELVGTARRESCAKGALWVFVMARDGSALRPELDALGAEVHCR
jgi:hypothetical protein